MHPVPVGLWWGAHWLRSFSSPHRWRWQEHGFLISNFNYTLFFFKLPDNIMTKSKILICTLKLWKCNSYFVCETLLILLLPILVSNLPYNPKLKYISSVLILTVLTVVSILRRGLCQETYIVLIKILKYVQPHDASY